MYFPFLLETGVINWYITTKWSRTTKVLRSLVYFLFLACPVITMQSNITTCNTTFAHFSTNTGFGLHPSNWKEACGDTGYLPSPTLWLCCASLPRRTTSKFSVLLCFARVTAGHVIGHQLHSRFHLRAMCVCECVCVCVCVRMPFG